MGNTLLILGVVIAAVLWFFVGQTVAFAFIGGMIIAKTVN